MTMVSMITKLSEMGKSVFSSAVSCDGIHKDSPEDMLSSLPDALICHIFSFLEIEDVVRTSALSKRWRHTWTETPVIRLSFGEDGRWKYSKILNYEEVMLQSTSFTIQKFHVKGFPLEAALLDENKLDPWLKFAIRRNVKDLRVELSGPGYALPSILFGCRSVVSLGFRGCSFYNLQGKGCSVNWSLLKSLSVAKARLCEEELQKVLEGSPLLESLELKGCHGMRKIRVHSTKMRELTIHDWDIEPVTSTDRSLPLSISAPNVSTLRLLGQWPTSLAVDLYDVGLLMALFLHLNPLRIVCLDASYLVGMKKRDMRLFECNHISVMTTAEEGELAGIAHMLRHVRGLKGLTVTIYIPNSSKELFLDPNDGDNDVDPSIFDVCRKAGSLSWTKDLKKVTFKGMDSGGKRLLPLMKLILETVLVLEELVINRDITSDALSMAMLESSDRSWRLLKMEVENCKKGSEHVKIVY